MTARISVFLTAILMLAAPAQARYVDANVSGDSVRLAFSTQLRSAQAQESEVHLETAYTYSEEIDEVDTHIGSIGLFVKGAAGPSAWKFQAGLGGRLYGVKAEEENGGALGLGGEFSFRFPTFDRMGVSGRLYWAPSIISFGDLDSLTEFALRFEYEVLKSAYVYLGYRVIRAKLEDGGQNFSLDKGVMGGLRINF